MRARTALDITQACERLREDRNIRAVVIASRNEDFCSGVAEDFDRFAVSPDPAAALSRLRIPLVASLSGQCSSAGLEVALACDIRIGTPKVGIRSAIRYTARFQLGVVLNAYPEQSRPGRRIDAVLRNRS